MAQDTLCLKNLNKYYGSFQALKNINLKFTSGELVAILGESGSGKSTLLNVISGLDKFNSGELTINGISSQYFDAKKWAIYRNHYIGFVFQEYNLIDHLTVVENVELPLLLQGEKASVARTKALEKCQLLGLSKHLKKLPKKLSGGQQQRTAIARALVTEPKVILADEPTGSLDSENAVVILDILKVLSKDHIVIVVTHDEEYAHKYADRIITLEDGCVISDSKPQELKYENTSNLDLKRPNMKAKVLGKFAYNNIKQRLFRTLFTAFTMSLGLIAIFLIVFLINGIRTEVTNIIREFIPKDQYIVESELTSGVISDEKYQYVVNHNLISEAYYSYQLYPLLETPTFFYRDNYSLIPIPINENSFYYQNYLIGDYPVKENEIIVTKALAENILGFTVKDEELSRALTYLKEEGLFIERISIKNKINIEFDIVGIIPGNQPIAYLLHPKLFALYDTLHEDDFEGYYNEKINKTKLNVFLSTNDKEKITNLEYELSEQGLILTNPTELIYGNVNDFFDTVMYILVAASSVSLVVAGILVGLMIYMSVIERVKEIGILTALGARRSNIRALFIFESASIGAVSSLIALSIALTISWIINTIFNNTVIRLFYSLGIFVFENMQLLRIDIITIILVFIIAIVYAVICGLIPAILASRLKAIDALRKE